ncbi:DUF5067 domain-containing protein [Alloscardovia sp. HMSC034E08]|uniref:DUF5067 domain-containing protein n=1 Tax=Alloscardovia sp. HMSC034E08 TaxID=1739413 RepID=UPI0008BA4418|nr:DUF5067 domain-containing protein [Alloscardovia sp. HMSC034E08]OFQ97556.1 hypothetical protein HMPREF2909_03060 [Alloscardovia sp. HMSC034E08]
MSDTLQEAPVAPAPDQTPKSTSALAITSLILGVIALVLSFIPIINNFAFVLAIIGVIFGVIGLVATGKKGKKKGRGLAIAGVVTTVLAMVITFAMQSAFSKAIDDATKEVTSSTSTSSKADKSEKSEASADGSVKIDNGNYTVKILSAAKSGADYEGKPTVLVTYEVTNNKDENSNFMDINAAAFQNGKSLGAAIYTENPEGYDPNSLMATLQPGATNTVTQGYVLNDETSEVTVEIKGTLDVASDAAVAKQKFPLQ